MRRLGDPNRLLYPHLPLGIIFLGILGYFSSGPEFTARSFLISAVAFFLYDSLGIQIGVHKHLCHRSFGTPLFVRRLLSLLSILSGQGSPLVWVAVHVGSHHPYADTEKDIHRPGRGLWFAFLAWYWRCDRSLINLSVARDYLRDPVLVFLHRHHTLLLLGWWLFLFLVSGAQGLVFAGLIPAALSVVLAGCVNAFLHSHGRLSKLLFLKYQNYPGDSTYNSVWLGVLTMGLGLHNNHHARPQDSFNDHRWFECDPSRLIIPLLRKG